MFIADLHIHSKYSRATSRDCVPELLDLWARRKGLNLIGTGDFTHPAWREELAEKLIPAEEGLYALKEEYRHPAEIAGGERPTRFILSGEISSIYKKNGKVRKIHSLILLPGLQQAASLSHRLEAIGGNLHSDGRPILGLDAKDLLGITLDVCPEALFIPAHIWTPHFSLFGAYSGFDDIRECFEELTGQIHALETGLSSDPPMNWRLSALDRFTLVSNSDAHSPGNLAREANLFSTELSYPHLSRALDGRDKEGFYGTLEFFPEEGKYHLDGHRNCRVCLTPAETKAAAGLCPVCGGRITVGVLHRTEELADRKEGFVPPSAKHFESLVPLPEVIAASMGLSSAGVKVKEKYDELLRALGPELYILREAAPDDIRHKAGPLVAEGICRLREGKVDIRPGYDGEYGKIKILDEREIGLFSGQTCLFEPEGKKEASPSDQAPKKPSAAPPVPPSAVEIPPQRSDGTAEKSAAGGFLSELNDKQREAVSAGGPAVLVEAGPGAGKTKTLVSRIIYLVSQCGVPPSQITAVTFTNKAAAEMKERLERHFGNKRITRAMTIGTFHSICLRILSEQTGEKNITVIDEDDALSILEESLKSRGLKKSPRDVLRGISLFKNGAATGADSDALSEICDLYNRRLARYGVCDYDDILLEVFRLYEAGGMEAGQHGRENPFSHLLVDEFQDINDLQYRLIRAWSQSGQSLFVIGDPNQSIYRFRGSDSRFFGQFAKDYPSFRKIALSANYRSTPEILRCAASAIPKMENAHPLEAKRESGARVRLLHAADGFSEAISAAKQINRMVGGIDMLDAASCQKGRISGRQHGFCDIAVLYRINRQAEMLEQCLAKEGIPYTVAGRDEFLSDRDVRNTLAFFRFLSNPGDLVSFRRCLSAFIRAGDDLSQGIIEKYAEQQKGLSSLADILQHTPLPEGSGLGKLLELLGRYESSLRREKPQKLIASFAEANLLSANPNMELLFHTAVMYERMESLLTNLALGREQDVMRSGGKAYTADAVSLMTLHAAKGLEFPVVFLYGLNEGMLPYRSFTGNGDPSEERRLFYVGMTRAKDELFLLTSGAPSPFLSDLPEDILVREEGFSHANPYVQTSLF